MYPKIHIISGLIFSFILCLIFPQINYFEVILIFISSVVIDVDHYFDYVFKKRSLNLKKAYKHFKEKKISIRKENKNQRKKHQSAFYLFHGIETVLIAIILGAFLSKYFYFIAIGILFHLILDWLELIIYPQKFFKISIIRDYLSTKK